MGTPDFSAGILESIISAGYEVVLAVTQPDRPKGRGGKVSMSPVKVCAVKHGIEVYQPGSVKNDEGIKKLSEAGADVFVVAAFGQILSKEILEIPEYGCINVHASLLPEYRGASPIQQAILDGKEYTGVTIMQMDEGLDTGDILYVKEVDITKDETGESLFDKLEECGRELIVEALDRIEKGDVCPVKQDESKATYAKILKKQMGEIDWDSSAVKIERLIRGFTPWPGTYTYLNGKLLKILGAAVASEEEVDRECRRDAAAKEPVGAGCIAGVSKDSIYVAAGEDYLRITKLQIEGKKKMDSRDFLLGVKLETGEKLGR